VQAVYEAHQGALDHTRVCSANNLEIQENVVFEPLLAEEMANDTDSQRERQAVFVGAHLWRERPRRFHKVGEGNARRSRRGHQVM
jgi:hypothetical protein